MAASAPSPQLNRRCYVDGCGALSDAVHPLTDEQEEELRGLARRYPPLGDSDVEELSQPSSAGTALYTCGAHAGRALGHVGKRVLLFPSASSAEGGSASLGDATSPRLAEVGQVRRLAMPAEGREPEHDTRHASTRRGVATAAAETARMGELLRESAIDRLFPEEDTPYVVALYDDDSLGVFDAAHEPPPSSARERVLRLGELESAHQAYVHASALVQRALRHERNVEREALQAERQAAAAESRRWRMEVEAEADPAQERLSPAARDILAITLAEAHAELARRERSWWPSSLTPRVPVLTRGVAPGYAQLCQLMTRAPLPATPSGFSGVHPQAQALGGAYHPELASLCGLPGDGVGPTSAHGALVCSELSGAARRPPSRRHVATQTGDSRGALLQLLIRFGFVKTIRARV